MYNNHLALFVVFKMENMILESSSTLEFGVWGLGLFICGLPTVNCYLILSGFCFTKASQPE